MKLFYKAGACSLSPHIVGREAGLSFTLEEVDLAQNKTKSGINYLTINPKGKVPALLLDDGTLLTEGVAILLYLADQAPNCNLISPAGSLLFYRTVEWLNYISTELHKGFGPLFNPNTPEEYKVIVRENLEKQFSYLETTLKKHQYLQGDHFRVVDAYLFTILRWAAAMQFNILQYPSLAAYFGHIAVRPAVEAALIAEGLTATLG